MEHLERRQCATAKGRSETGAASVGDLREAEIESRELPQHTRRRWRQRVPRIYWRRRRRHESGEAIVAERVGYESELLQRGPPPQGRGEGHQSRVMSSVAL